MREVLFRGKSVYNGKWIYGIPSNYIDNDMYIGVKSKGIFKVNEDTIGQYIGLKDIHGVEIFEGDILMRDWKQNYYHNPETTIRNYIVRYNANFGAFICEHIQDETFCTFDGDSNLFEVIGNIYDTPECLLGQS